MNAGDVTFAASIISRGGRPPALSAYLSSNMSTAGPDRSLWSDRPVSPAPLVSEYFIWDFLLELTDVVPSLPGGEADGPPRTRASPFFVRNSETDSRRSPPTPELPKQHSPQSVPVRRRAPSICPCAWSKPLATPPTTCSACRAPAISLRPAGSLARSHGSNGRSGNADEESGGL